MTKHTSFAAGRGDLPGGSFTPPRAPVLGASFETSRDPMIAAQHADLQKSEAERRASQMVANDRPKPVQRPSPALAHTPDGEAFNARWRAEQDAASRDARKAEFKARRQTLSPKRDFSRSR
ncbi:hypothetical protein [Hyphobacterium sp.]|uniref:hypothetical protein n=1 Tax=Hyphobacterium sp. TaxID=2004662 RepID=UPI003749B778